MQCFGGQRWSHSPTELKVGPGLLRLAAHLPRAVGLERGNRIQLILDRKLAPLTFRNRRQSAIAHAHSAAGWHQLRDVCRAQARAADPGNRRRWPGSDIWLQLRKLVAELPHREDPRGRAALEQTHDGLHAPVVHDEVRHDVLALEMELSDRLSRFLDDTMVTDVSQIRIVHGHGTGALRKGLQAFLKTHPLVEKHYPAPDNQGGGGATIVELKE